MRDTVEVRGDRGARAVGSCQIDPLEPRRLLSVPVEVVGGPGSDAFLLSINGTGAVQLWQNAPSSAAPTLSWSPGDHPAVVLQGNGGEDVLFVDFANGNPLAAVDLDFEGGAERDTLVLLNLSNGPDVAINPAQVSVADALATEGAVESILLQPDASGLMRLGALRLSGPVHVELDAGRRALRVTGLELGPESTLDLSDGTLIVKHADLDGGAARTGALISDVLRARRGASGPWQNPGLMGRPVREDPLATRTMGVLSNNAGPGIPLLKSIGGYAIEADDILVRATYCGDTDLDGEITGSDYAVTDLAYWTTVANPGWRNGDANYDGAIQGDDYAVMDLAYWTQGPAVATVPPDVGIGSPTLLDTFDARAWRANNAKLAVDPQHAAPVSKRNEGLLVTWNTPGGNADVWRYLDAPVDLSQSHAILRFYVPPSSRDQIKEVFFYAGNDGTANAYVSWHAKKPVVGWNQIQFIPDTRAWGVQKLGNPDLTRINTLRVLFKAVDGAMPTVTLGSYEWHPRTDRKLVTHYIDDGYASTWSEAMYWSSRGIRVNIAIIPSKIGKSGYLTLDQLYQLQRMGHLIVNHTYSHDFWQNQTPAEKIREIDAAAEWMIQRGFGRGARIVVIPRIGADHETDPDLIGTHVSLLREQMGPPNTLIQTGIITLTATESNMPLMLRTLKDVQITHGLAVTTTHGINMQGGTTTADQMRSFIDSAAAEVGDGNIEFITADELLDPAVSAPGPSPVAV